MKKMVAPSLLSANFNCLGAQIDELKNAGADILHLDIMDGHFVPDITFGTPVVRSLAKESSLNFDIHLMIENPDKLIPGFVTPKTEYITVHAESVVHLQRTLSLIRKENIKAGVSLNPSTPLSALDYIYDDIDLVLLMSVNPGYAGQTFIESSVEKLEKLCKIREEKKLDFKISMDGGIDAKRAKLLFKSGLDIAVAGSAIFNAPDISEAIKEFKS